MAGSRNMKGNSLHLPNPSMVYCPDEIEMDKLRKKMGDEREIIGYFTDDRNIYCVECINKNRDIMEKIERAITADDTEEGELFCDECKKEIK